MVYLCPCEKMRRKYTVTTKVPVGVSGGMPVDSRKDTTIVGWPDEHAAAVLGALRGMNNGCGLNEHGLEGATSNGLYTHAFENMVVPTPLELGTENATIELGGHEHCDGEKSASVGDGTGLSPSLAVS